MFNRAPIYEFTSLDKKQLNFRYCISEILKCRMHFRVNL